MHRLARIDYGCLILYSLEPFRILDFHDGMPEVELRLRRTVRVRGVVREKGTGRPLSNVEIACSMTYGNVTRFNRARADASGRFELCDIRCRMEYEVEEGKSGGRFCVAPRCVTIPAGRQQFDLPPLELALARARVTDQNGKPIAGAEVRFWSRRPAARGIWPLSLLSSVDSEDTLKAAKLTSGPGGRFEVWVDPETQCAAELADDRDEDLVRRTNWVPFKSLPDGTLPDLVAPGQRSRVEVPAADNLDSR